MTTTLTRSPIPTQPQPLSRAVALLATVAGWVTPGIIAAGYAFGAPVTPTLLRRRCLYLSSSPEGRRSR